MIGIGDSRQWLRVLGDAARARLPADLVLAGHAFVALLAIASLAMPAIAMGRAVRLVAPRLRRPFALGALAWLAVFAASVAFTASGAEQWLARLFVVPRG